MRTISALYDDYEDATDAVGDLERAGFTAEEVSIVSGHNSDERHSSDRHPGLGGSGQLGDTQADSDTSATGAGAGVGGVLGGGAGLLAALGTITIPGVGPIIGAGWLVSTLAGAAAGAVGGGLVGALIDAGTSENDAHSYAEGVRGGSTLVSARVPDDRFEEAVALLRRHSPRETRTGERQASTSPLG